MTSSHLTAQAPEASIAVGSGVGYTRGPYEVCLMTCAGGPAPVVCSTATGAQIASLALNPNAEADAFLLAAAPDLYEALVDLVIHVSMGWEVDGPIDAAEAALARAEGRS